MRVCSNTAFNVRQLFPTNLANHRRCLDVRSAIPRHLITPRPSRGIDQTRPADWQEKRKVHSLLGV